MSDPFGPPRLRKSLLGLAGAAGIIAGPAASAQTAPPFAQLFRETENAPRQIAIEADVERAEGLAQQAHARPNPNVSALTENIGGQSPYNGFNRSETTVQFNQPIELGGKRSARIAAGEAGVEAARARGVDARLNYAYDLARAYGGAEIADRRIGLAEDELAKAEDDLRVARALVGAGKEARLRSLQAETDANSLRAALSTAVAERVVAYARLSALAGQGSQYMRLSEPLLTRLDQGPQYGPIDPLRTAPYLAAKAERDAAAYRVTLARKQAVPDVTISLGARRLQGDRANALLVGISLPLPILDRNRGNVAAAQAELRGAGARVEAARLESASLIEAVTTMNEAANVRVAAAQKTLETAEESYRLARIAYEAGKSPLIELLTARRGLGLARGVVLEAEAARFDVRANLARLKGQTIMGDQIQ
ncbi:MAG: TolC family protein [Sphingopyxis sp.]|nr:TolC family protein [Sphingopyxis sp.]